MIDRRAINILYNDQVGKKLVEDFYQLLVVYSQNEKIKEMATTYLELLTANSEEEVQTE